MREFNNLDSGQRQRFHRHLSGNGGWQPAYVRTSSGASK
jgi:hypothetical protein